MFSIEHAEKNTQSVDQNVHFWHLRNPLVKLKFYVWQGVVVGVQGVRVKPQKNKETYLRNIFRKEKKKKPIMCNLIEVIFIFVVIYVIYINFFIKFNLVN